MVIRMIYISLFCLGIANASAQKNSVEVFPKNQIDIFYHTDHFFDNSETLWLKFNKRLSPGVQYTRNIKNKHNVRFSASYFFYNYASNSPEKADNFILGDVYDRHFLISSFGYIYNFLKLKFFEIDFLGEYNLRIGSETVFVYKPNWWEVRTHSFKLVDSGISLGTRLGFNIKNFIISLEAKYTSYIIRPDKFTYPDENHINRSSQNTATFKFGLGYRF